MRAAAHPFMIALSPALRMCFSASVAVLTSAVACACWLLSVGSTTDHACDTVLIMSSCCLSCSMQWGSAWPVGEQSRSGRSGFCTEGVVTVNTPVHAKQMSFRLHSSHREVSLLPVAAALLLAIMFTASGEWWLDVVEPNNCDTWKCFGNPCLHQDVSCQ